MIEENHMRRIECFLNKLNEFVDICFIIFLLVAVIAPIILMLYLHFRWN